MPRQTLTTVREKCTGMPSIDVLGIDGSLVASQSDQSLGNCHGGNNDKSIASRDSVFRTLLSGLGRSVVLIMITGLCVWRWRFHHLGTNLSILHGVNHLAPWIDSFHRHRSETLVAMGESNSKEQTHKRGVFPPIPTVDCSQFIRHAESSAVGGDIGSTADALPWIDPYDGILPPHLYTLPNPSPQDVRVGLYEKEYEFVQTAVSDPSSHQTHMAQRKMLEILTSHRAKNNRYKTTMVQVGGQIGWFSMQAAAIGTDVHVLEANPINVLRICRNSQLNQHDDNKASLLQVYHVSVMDEIATESNIQNVDLSLRLGRGVFAHQSEFVPTLLQTGKQLNQQAVIYPIQQQMNVVDGEDGIDEETNLPIPQVTLDAWATQYSLLDKSDNAMPQSSQNRASVVDLLKIDVLRGHEIDILFGARQLLKSHRIRNILMDIQLQQDVDTDMGSDPSLTFSSSNVITKSSPHAKMAEFLVDNGYQVHDKHAKVFLPVLQGTNDNGTASMDSILEFMNRYCRSMGNRCHLWWKVQGDA